MSLATAEADRFGCQRVRTLHLPTDVDDRLSLLAHQRQVTVSELIRSMIEVARIARRYVLGDNIADRSSESSAPSSPPSRQRLEDGVRDWLQQTPRTSWLSLLAAVSGGG